MVDELRDIAPIEHSYFIISLLLLIVAIVIILGYFFWKMKKDRPTPPIDPFLVWRRLKAKFIKRTSGAEPKKYYYLLNMLFREFLQKVSGKNYSTLPLSRALTEYTVDTDLQKEIETALGRIYRGDYFYTKEEEEKLMSSDLETIGRVVLSIAGSIDKNVQKDPGKQQKNSG
ncbi:hypothetical protein KAU32_03840 [bacterium]|nr:hypothetical protein [bacterium]